MTNEEIRRAKASKDLRRRRLRLRLSLESRLRMIDGDDWTPCEAAF